jgi:hypothetical protein
MRFWALVQGPKRTCVSQHTEFRKVHVRTRTGRLSSWFPSFGTLRALMLGSTEVLQRRQSFRL